jgi:3-hydroxybutyryl-CoA dehydrogenase
MILAPIKTVGVIGAGPMGNGIAQCFATAGYEVTLNDISKDALDRAAATIEKNLYRMVARSKVGPEEMECSLQNISLTNEIDSVGGCDLVIEAATENEEVKSQIFDALGQSLEPHTILATNTSSISMTRLARRTDRSEKFMGVHFMNLVPVIKLVELIHGIATSKDTFESMSFTIKQLGKTIATAEDFPVFIVNRLLISMINESVYALYEGVGGVASIDSSLKLGANLPMGPLELGDFIGPDTCLAIMTTLHNGFSDTKYRPCPLLVKYVEAGWLGRKSGRGFYDYSSEKPVPTR